MRRLRRILPALALLAVGAALLSPWWIPAAARPVLARQGVTFGRHERPRLARMALTDVRFARPGAGEFTAARVETDTPLLFLLRHQFSRPGPVQITAWRYTLPAASGGETSAGAASEADAGAPGDWVKIRALINDILAALAKWLPALGATGGEIAWPGDADNNISLPSLSWRADAASTRLEARSLACLGHTADAVLASQTAAGTLTLDLSSGSEKLLQFLRENHADAPADAPDSGALRLTFVSTATGLSVRLSLLGQAATLTARFVPGSWLPAEAVFDAPALAIPAASLPFGDGKAAGRRAAAEQIFAAVAAL
ncbi:MAG: hypothetical protein LBM92_03445, partial [Opitutaceae bacterium]|nr:hypothetical protein [Opitutaceae bacterium]